MYPFLRIQSVLCILWQHQVQASLITLGAQLLTCSDSLAAVCAANKHKNGLCVQTKEKDEHLPMFPFALLPKCAHTYTHTPPYIHRLHEECTSLTLAVKS